MPRLDRRKLVFLVAGIPAVLSILRWIFLSGSPGLFAQFWTVTWLTITGIWVGRWLLRLFLWRVSRRLAFSYALIGVVPIPLVAIVIAVGLYVLAGFFLGHHFFAVVGDLQVDLVHEARHELDARRARLARDPERETDLPVAFAYYRDGRRVEGDARAPEQWGDFWPRASHGPLRESVPFFDLDDRPTLLGAATAGRDGVLAIFDGDLPAELSRRSGVWVELTASDLPSNVTFVLNGTELPLFVLEPQAENDTIRTFFGTETSESYLDRPFVRWAELARPFSDPATGRDTGERTEEAVAVTLISTPRALVGELLPMSPEVNFFVYLVFFLFFLVTFLLYMVALLMALTLIFGLSKAVNRLTEATRRVQEGDFAARIRVERSDQVGALQRNFNDTAASLERLVAEAAQKEIFERELSIAQEMQRSLLPDALEAPDDLDFVTYFRPSRAIGGDYYDLLPLADGRLAVVVADVSGHGLPAGLRMAMVKSAVELLCAEGESPTKLLSRLHHLLADRLRRPGQRRAFVTATIAALDLDTGALEIANAGHPPTYLLRAGDVREISLPSPPLGTLSDAFPSEELRLETGDVLVWLSDGLIEATDAQDEAFGFERVLQSLRASAEAGRKPEGVKQHLLEAVAEHYGQGGQLDDDLTLVVMGYTPIPREE